MENIRYIRDRHKNPLSIDIKKIDYDTNVILNKVIKTLNSCKTKEQFNNTHNWIKWVFGYYGSTQVLSPIELGMFLVLKNLMNVKREEIWKHNK